MPDFDEILIVSTHDGNSSIYNYAVLCDITSKTDTGGIL
jgi:hypothetical protein